MKWKNVTLEDISSNIQTGPFGSQLHQSDYAKEGTPVIMPKDLIGKAMIERDLTSMVMTAKDMIVQGLIN